MSAHHLQMLDASCLIGCALVGIVLVQRDFHDAPGPVRASFLWFSFACWAQAMWLLGVWIPTDAGYPWPRTLLDGSLLVASLARLFYRTKHADRPASKAAARHQIFS